ncbi:twin-arginine translocation signal domain-containing protein [Alcanivorax sp. S6407]|uniref:twin-arginine translocation signal domain-containing protein n=1 Tax=Alcanivorax sp. S6407 TaxID=2926424 RepID=UPI001FF2015A|nr:twin-arginine translocation signal domain-containing protein [Alcanivorax sp. S6407]MCK0153469.1 twin-arginine translocation signal domain-containing protein [Alcanivorax sp. S6407]
MIKHHNNITHDDAAASPDDAQPALSRRQFLARSAVVTAAVAAAPALLKSRTAHAGVLPQAMITDTLNAVLAFVVPGGDPYSYNNS